MVRIRTTVGSATRGEREVLLQRVLLARGFMIESRPTSDGGGIAPATRTTDPDARAVGIGAGIKALARAAEDHANPALPNTAPGWLAVSHEIDGQDVKDWLRAQGFADREFKIRVEYQRAWGCL
ncbi:MAG: hypothetical protein Q4A16_00170 [Lautropia sp.]|nr:hypothetical protein [Lautropia sp.]